MKLRQRMTSVIAAMSVTASSMTGGSLPPIEQEVAKALRPRPKILPSVWAEQHRHIGDDSPQPGRWSNDYLPWIGPILDAYFLELDKEGWLWMKPAQSAGSQIAVTLVLCLADIAPGPMLYICSTQEQAKRFATERFDHAIQASDTLREKFTIDRRKTTLLKPFVGGALGLTGSGSESGVVSNPCRYVVLDEYDLLRDFPNLGSAPKVAEKRIGEFKSRTRTGIFGFAHPTTSDRGIAKAIETTADPREWSYPCPHCQAWHHPDFERDVRFGEIRKSHTATLHCPECGKQITDAQRWAATRKGKFISQLEDQAEARRRRFIGFHTSALCHPRKTIQEIAQEYCECVSESDMRVFWNMTLGLPYEDASMILTEEGIKAKAEAAERGHGRMIPANARIVTIGVDVQKPDDHPTMFIRADAWTEDGNDYIIEFVKVQGWAALKSYITTFEAKKPDGSIMKPIGVGIDCGYRTEQVYEFCRARPGGIECVPMKYETSVDQAEQTRIRNIKDPTRTELGRMVRLQLNRGYWMDRQAARFAPDRDPHQGGSVVVPISVTKPIDVSREFIAHIKANKRVEIIDDNGHPKLVWLKDKAARDDWFQAGVYGEVIAKGRGLDRWHLEAPIEPGERISEIERGLRREARFRGRPSSGSRNQRPRGGRIRGW